MARQATAVISAPRIVLAGLALCGPALLNGSQAIAFTGLGVFILGTCLWTARWARDRPGKWSWILLALGLQSLFAFWGVGIGSDPGDRTDGAATFGMLAGIASLMQSAALCCWRRARAVLGQMEGVGLVFAGQRAPAGADRLRSGCCLGRLRELPGRQHLPRLRARRPRGDPHRGRHVLLAHAAVRADLALARPLGRVESLRR